MRSQRFLASVVFFVTACGASVVTDAVRGRADSLPFALWSVAPALLVLPVAAALAAVSARWRVGTTFLVAGGAAVGFSLVWTQLVICFIGGPYIMPFIAPITLFWLAGATVGLFMDVFLRRSGAVRSSPFILVAPIALVLVVGVMQPKRPLDLVVELVEPRSEEDRQDVLGVIAGVAMVVRSDLGFYLRFDPTSDPELRTKCIAKLRSSPLVASVTEVSE